MKYDKTLYGESDLFEMIDASEERSTNGVNISVALESKAVKEEEIKKSAKELEPFSSEELEGYTMPGNDLSRIQIVCGRIVEITVEDEQAVINVEACDGSGSAVIRAKKEDVLDKAKTMQKGDPVTAVIAQVCDMIPGELVHMIADAHIYDRHVDIIKKLLEREPLPAPVVKLNPDVKNFYDFTVDDLIVEDYQTHPQLTWWDGILNGSNALDGSTNLNHWYPTEFRPVYPFDTVLTENFIADRIFHRIPDVYHENIFKPSFFVRSDFVWWEGFLDGNFSLDGTRKLNSWYPMETFIGHRLFIGNQEAFETKQCISLPDMINAEKADFRGTQRVIMGWRDGNKILDGNCLLDGTLLLDAGEPPYLQTVRIRAPVKHEEEVEVTMVIPSRAARLDGTCRLDGSVKLNSGREVL